MVVLIFFLIGYFVFFFYGFFIHSHGRTSHILCVLGKPKLEDKIKMIMWLTVSNARLATFLIKVGGVTRQLECIFSVLSNVNNTDSSALLRFLICKILIKYAFKLVYTKQLWQTYELTNGLNINITTWYSLQQLVK